MRLIAVLIAVVLASPTVQAGVVIAQVLYDPAGTESGGEAVELRNDGSVPVNISGWTLASETSAADALLPAGTVLAPEAAYLVADAGWSAAKDNPAWKNADHEETITLANSDSGVALKDASGAIVDAVGWGDPAEIKQGLFEGTPAEEALAGEALVRQQDTNNNAADFISGEPQFFGGESVSIVVNVSESTLDILPLGAALAEDDSPEPGVQLLPYAGASRTLRLEANYSGPLLSVNWRGKEYAAVRAGEQWAAELPLDYWTPPGGLSILVRAGAQNASIPVTVLPLKATRIETKRVELRTAPGRSTAGKIAVKNIGNVPAVVSWAGSDLRFGEKSIAFENLDVEETTIAPAEAQEIAVSLSVPAGAVVGEYRTVLRMTAE